MLHRHALSRLLTFGLESREDALVLSREAPPASTKTRAEFRNGNAKRLNTEPLHPHTVYWTEYTGLGALLSFGILQGSTQT